MARIEKRLAFTLVGVTCEYLIPDPGHGAASTHSWTYGKYPQVMATLALAGGATLEMRAHTEAKTPAHTRVLSGRRLAPHWSWVSWVPTGIVCRVTSQTPGGTSRNTVAPEEAKCQRMQRPEWPWVSNCLWVRRQPAHHVDKFQHVSGSAEASLDLAHSGGSSRPRGTGRSKSCFCSSADNRPVGQRSRGKPTKGAASQGVRA